MDPKVTQRIRFVVLFAPLLVNSIGAHGTVQAQEPSPPPLTLEQAIEEGLARSPEIQRERAAKSESEWHRFEALGGGFLPKISVSAYHYFAKEYTITGITFPGLGNFSFPGFYPTNVASVDISIPIFDGLSNIMNLNSAALAEEASSAQLSYAEFELKENLRLAFYKTLATQELLSVAEQNVKTLEDHLRQVEVQKSGGVATQYDVLRVQVQLNEARADSMDAQDGYEMARRNLTQLMGLESDPRPLSGTIPIPEVDQIKNLKIDDVSQDRSDIRALRLKAEAAEKSRQGASTWMVPSLSLAGNYTYYDSQIFAGTVQDTGKYLGAYNIGAFLRWNLFDGGVALAREREAAYRSVQAEKATESAKLKVPYDFEYWKRRYLSNTDHYISKKFDITRSEESVRIAKEEERAGTRTSTETLDAELDLFRAKAGVVNALINAAEAKIRLELVLEKEI